MAEDDVAVRRAAVDVLSNCGYALLVARDVHHAIELAATHQGQIHLLLTDVVMPQLGGRVLAERVKAVRPEIKLLDSILSKRMQFSRQLITVSSVSCLARQR